MNDMICTYIGINAFGKHEECVRRERTGHVDVERIMKRRVGIRAIQDVKIFLRAGS